MAEEDVVTAKLHELDEAIQDYQDLIKLLRRQNGLPTLLPGVTIHERDHDIACPPGYRRAISLNNIVLGPGDVVLAYVKDSGNSSYKATRIYEVAE